MKSSEVSNPRPEAIRPFEMDITTPSVFGIHFGICWKVSLVVFGMHAFPRLKKTTVKEGDIPRVPSIPFPFSLS